MKACFYIDECSLSYAKTVQTSSMKACFYIDERSLSYAKLVEKHERTKKFSFVFQKTAQYALYQPHTFLRSNRVFTGFQTRLLCITNKPCLHSKEALFMMQTRLVCKPALFSSETHAFHSDFQTLFRLDTHLYAKPGQAIYIKGVKSTACINNICRIRCCITPDHYKNPSKLYKTAYVLHFNTIFDAKVKIF